MSNNLLAVDTATERCGVSVIADGYIRAELSLNIGGSHTKHILPAVETVLSLVEIPLADIDAFAVTQGPGSFTGLRIGVSTVKGLAFAAGKPLIGISSLEVLAHQAGDEGGVVCPMIDARRNEVYWRLFRRADGRLRPIGDELVGPIEALAGQIDETCIVIGNAVSLYADRLQRLLPDRVRWSPESDNGIRPGILAQLAWQRYERGLVDDVETFAPVYIRKSDAESLHRG